MIDLTILRERNPAAAEFVADWDKKYGRAYNFESSEDQAIFYEGVVEMARYLATNSTTGNLHVAVNSDGVWQLESMVTPTQPSLLS